MSAENLAKLHANADFMYVEEELDGSSHHRTLNFSGPLQLRELHVAKDRTALVVKRHGSYYVLDIVDGKMEVIPATKDASDFWTGKIK